MELHNVRGKLAVSSVDIAHLLDREHSNVLQGIDRLCEISRRDGLPLDDAIVPETYPHPLSERPERCYLLARRGAVAYAERLRGVARATLLVELNKTFKGEDQ